MRHCYSSVVDNATKKTASKRERRNCNGSVRGGVLTVQLPLPMAEALASSHGIIEQLAGEVGLMIAQAVLNDEVERRAGEAYNRADAAAYRWGYRPGYIVLGGRKVGLRRPRLREQGRDVALETYRLLQSDGRMQRAAREKMLVGVSTRNYERAVGDFVEGYGLQRSSISRHFVAASAQKVAELCARPVGELGLVALLLDGKEYAGHTFVVALGVDEEGRKHALGLWDGATENAAVCGALLDDLIRRGLDPKGRYLFVIDGSKALPKAIRQRFGERSPIQRCQVHKKRNVREHLPEKWKGLASMKLSAAYGMNTYEEAHEALEKSVKWLRGISEGAARSLEEGLEETLTLHRLGVPPMLRKSLSSTNIIESCLSVVGELTKNVKRWKSVSMVRRWMGSALLEAEQKFNRIRGHKGIPLLTQLLLPPSVVAVERRTG